jgi:microcystin-dependent protein
MSHQIRRNTTSYIGIAVVFGLAMSVYADATSYTGGGGSHRNTQPSLAVKYLIAIEGTFPSRSVTAAGAPEPVDPFETFTGDPFLGEVTMFGGNFAPRGWASCEGQLLAISSHEALFSILGTTYGGDGRTTFALPDLRGRMPIGPRTGAGLSPRALGQRGGVENVTLTYQQMPHHNHSLPDPISPTLNAGGNQVHENMQPFLGLNYITSLVGVYPSRNVTIPDGEQTESSAIDPYIGGVTMFAGNFAPRSWAFADGQLLPIASNQALFSILGTTYGGDGRTTFALPDLRGRTPIGPRHGAGLSNRTLGERVGAETDSLSIAEMPSHDHDPPIGNIDIGHTGNSQASGNMAPSLGLNYVIALQGIFPSRSAVAEGGESELEALGVSPFIGEISLFGGNFAPRDWAFCDGQLLPIASHTALFSLLGTTYGGDGRSTFALPDLRGRAALGDGRGAGLSDWRLGERDGSETITLNLNQLPNHNHQVDPGPAGFGDTDGDWDIDEFDYNTFRGQFGMTGPPGMLASDFDADGDVDLFDFKLLREAFGIGVSPAPAPSPPVAAGAVPEPATLLLLAIGGAGLLTRRGRNR